MPSGRFLLCWGNRHRDLRHVGRGAVADDVIDQGDFARGPGRRLVVFAHIVEQLLVAWDCSPVRAVEANGQAARGGSCLDVALVAIGIVEQKEDLVVAVRVTGGQALGANPNAQVAQKDKGLVLALLQLTNLPLQRIGVGRVDAFAQHGVAKRGDMGPLLSMGGEGRQARAAPLRHQLVKSSAPVEHGKRDNTDDRRQNRSTRRGDAHGKQRIGIGVRQQPRTGHANGRHGQHVVRKADVALSIRSEKAAKANVDAGKDCIGYITVHIAGTGRDHRGVLGKKANKRRCHQPHQHRDQTAVHQRSSWRT